LFGLGWLQPDFELGFQAPQISFYNRLQTNLVFPSARALRNPNYPKLGLVLFILQGEQAAQFQVATDRSQPYAGIGNVQSVYQIRVRTAIYRNSANPHGQNRLLPVAVSLGFCGLGSLLRSPGRIASGPISHNAPWGNHASILMATMPRANSLIVGQCSPEVVAARWVDVYGCPAKRGVMCRTFVGNFNT